MNQNIRRWFLALVPFIPAIWLFSMSVWGIDFGHHWDESYNKTRAVEFSLKHDFTLLPDSYIYPGFNYVLTLATLTPELLNALKTHGPDAKALADELGPVVTSEAFMLRLRHVYAAITSLTCVWLYFTVMALGGGRWGAFACSCLLATSWEVGYHARWVAPDGVLMQFGALVLLLVVVSYRRKTTRWLRYAAVAAGLGAGTKYPGGLLLVPIVGTAWFLAFQQRQLLRGVIASLTLPVWFFAVYFATTPGTLIQPLMFLRDQVASAKNYAGGWGGHTVLPGVEHLSKVAVYFSSVFFSPYTVVALASFCLVLLGTWRTVKDGYVPAVLLLSFPLLYLMFFSRQAALIVRNYLVISPFLAMLAWRGGAWLFQRVKPELARKAFAGVIAASVLSSAAYQASAASSIASRRNKTQFVDQFLRYVEQRPHETFVVSAGVVQQLQQRGRWPLPNLALRVTERDPLGGYAGYYSEVIKPRNWTWPVNRSGTFVAVFGPGEVNHHYYTGWEGDDRIVLVSPERARQLLPAQLNGKP